MSLSDKLSKAEPTDWLIKDIPEWKVNFLIWWAKFKAKIYLWIKGADR